MFGSKKKGAIEVAKLSSLIADNLHIVGDVHFSGGLRVDGSIEGNVIGKPGGKGLVVLSEKGSITGKVQAYDAVINGTICGDIDVEHFLELQSNANVTGNLRYRQLQMDCGATVDGKLMRVHEVESADARRGASAASEAGTAAAAAPVLRTASARVEPAPAGSPGIEPRPISEPRASRPAALRDGENEPSEKGVKERSAAATR
ncbi:bactofilin family protein [Pseudazoarcus pumilus]|uniref:Cell shape determination protein CcmA n=1 Tax=Pseudazoarcus pumilus TaxID=2067960 RepID=A0A2I6S753_9RHOO|nr:polymer-forming cytoskeletal protein [Pseudazoarcus pumilus]AUN95100.1 hypothetical protein C0099_09215 [Pseudazoarcus pumilus]